MSLFPLSGASIKGRVLASFPASVTGSGGISVEKANGVYTIEPDWTALDVIDSSEVVSSKQTWVYDPSTGVYARVPLSSIVSALGQAGAGISLNFSADLTATSDADPGAGKLRFNDASQNAATELYVDDEDVNGMDVIATIASLDDSTTTVKGQLSISKVGDATKRLIFNVTALTDASGYTKLTVANLASSDTSPFVEGDTLLFAFTRTGDSGSSSGDVTAASSFGTDNVMIRADGTGKGVQATGIVIADTTDDVSDIGTILPKADNTQQLGSTSKNWADLFLGSGAVVNWNAGDVTLTHSANTLTWAGATSYTFDVAPNVAGSFCLTQALNRNVVGGVTATSYDAGTKSSGTFTPDALNGNIQHCVNGGAFTLAPPANASSIILQVVNNGSAGTITTSGFSKVEGDAVDTTNGSAFRFVIVKMNTYSTLTVTKIA
jgi:hypothetical protein